VSPSLLNNIYKPVQTIRPKDIPDIETMTICNPLLDQQNMGIASQLSASS